MKTIQQFLYEPWPWYVVGPLMGATIPLLLFWGNKMLGASSSFRHLCAMIPNQVDYFQYDYRKDLWNLLFVLGVALGASVTYGFFYRVEEVEIALTTQTDLLALGLNDLSGLLPEEIFGTHHLWSLKGLFFSMGGGFLVGFGVRYAGGCTSGHGFMGLSQFSLSSAIAILAFFAGGVIFTFLILPFVIQ